MKCDRKGCEMRATWRLGAKLWAKGYSKKRHAPAEMFSDVKLCDAHKNDPGPCSDFFIPEAREQIIAEFIAKGHAAPDFDTAEWLFTPIENPEPLQ